MQTWLIGQDDIGRIVGVIGKDVLMRRMIRALESGLADLGHGRILNSPPRTGFVRNGDVPGVLETMPHHHPGSGVTVKMVSYSPANVTHHGLPTILGTIARIDDATGHLVAFADAVLLTALRTGAASAVATTMLARPDSTIVGLIGAGAQSVTQLHGLAQVLDINEVLVHDVVPERVRSFRDRVSFLGVDVVPAAPSTILARSDVLCTATSVAVGRGPVVLDGPHQPHLHINSIGADEVGKTELPLSLLRRALVCVDHLEQAREEGESQQLSDTEIGPTLATLCAHPDEWRGHRDKLTVFDSTGFALEDHVAMDVLMAAAEELGLGTKVSLETEPEDALNPYSIPDNDTRRTRNAI